MFFKKFKKIGDVTLVHDSDLKHMLKKLGKLEDIENKKERCKFTKETITLKNIHAIFYENNNLKFTSDSVDSIKLFSEYLNKKRSL